MMLNKIKALFGPQDMTQGSPTSRILLFALPMLFGNVIQQLYNTVDAIVVGKYVGDTALAAVGASGPLVNLLLVLFAGVSTGAGIMVSQYFGAKDERNLADTIGNTLVLTVIVSAIMAAAGVLLSKPMLRMLSTPPDVIDMATQYMAILFAGILGCAFYNIISGLLRGLGDSVMPLLFLMFACACNIVLDLVLVKRLGVAGVAYGTIISQGLSSVLCLIRIYHMRHSLHLTRSSFRLRARMVLQIAKLGLPSGVTQAVFSLAQIIVQSLINQIGTIFISCCVMIMRVDAFAMMPNFSFGMAMSTYAGQNMGAGDLKRVSRGTRDGLLLSVSVSAALTLIILLFGRQLLSLFTNTPEIIDLGVRMMRILAVGYVAMAVTQVLGGVMRGAGDTMTPMWISFVTTVVLRVPIAYGIAYLTRSPEWPQGAPLSIYVSLLISWVVGALISFVCYRVGKWKRKGITSAGQGAAQSVEAKEQEA